LDPLENASDRSGGGDLVSVVVPAYNAEATLNESLESARAQSHRALEIIVIDDGSTDATSDIVLEHARLDSRVRLLRQANSGVAAARNAGIATARGHFIAPMDADDLWHPQNIEKQLAALRRGGQRAGLAYAWSLMIDTNSCVIGSPGEYHFEGDVVRALCRSNFLINCSSALIRKSAILEVGGFDSSLHQRSAQGCEDWRLYLAVAQRYDYAVVPEYLIGYRKSPQNMSSDLLQMARSGEFVLGDLLSQRGDLAADIAEGRFKNYLWLYHEALARGRDADARFLRGKLIRLSPYRAFKAFFYWPTRSALKQLIIPAAEPKNPLEGMSFGSFSRSTDTQSGETT
jgi:glycosyltransferase involved in cell wall biosynthesis